MCKAAFIAPRALVSISVLMTQACLIFLRVIDADSFRNHFLTVIIIRILIIIFVIILIPLRGSCINFIFSRLRKCCCFCLSFLLFSFVSTHAIKLCLRESRHLLIGLIYSLLFLWRLFNFFLLTHNFFLLQRWLWFIIYSWRLLFYQLLKFLNLLLQAVKF